MVLNTLVNIKMDRSMGKECRLGKIKQNMLGLSDMESFMVKVSKRGPTGKNIPAILKKVWLKEKVLKHGPISGNTPDTF